MLPINIAGGDKSFESKEENDVVDGTSDEVFCSRRDNMRLEGIERWCRGWSNGLRRGWVKKRGTLLSFR